MEPAPQARRGYRQDQRPDGLAGVMAAVQTAEGFPLADEAMAGNPRDQTALKTFLKQIEAQSGKGQRREIMDRGIPTEETSKQRWDSDPLIWYLVGTPHARWKEFAAGRVAVPWQRLQDAVDVKLLGRRDEVYGRAKSQGRATKQVAMRRSQLARLRRTLRALRRPRQQCWKRDTRRLKLGAARKEAGWAWALVKVQLPPPSQPVHRDRLRFERRKDKLQAAELRDGHYLVRSFRAGDQAGTLWECDRPWTERQAAFKSLKGDLPIGPFRHHLEERIEAHLLGCFFGLRLEGDLAPTVGGPRAGMDVAGGVGEALDDPDVGGASAVGREAGTGAAALPATGERTPVGAGDVGRRRSRKLTQLCSERVMQWLGVGAVDLSFQGGGSFSE